MTTTRQHGRVARELSEIDPDPLDWWEGPPARRPRWLSYSAWRSVVLVACGVALVLALVVLFIVGLKVMP
jgi:hypothetical protein